MLTLSVRSRRRRRESAGVMIRGIVLALSLLILSDSVIACSVCFGDPESPMMKGAVAGVYVMVGFISSILVCIAATTCLWAVRARRLAGSHLSGSMDS